MHPIQCIIKSMGETGKGKHLQVMILSFEVNRSGFFYVLGKKNSIYNASPMLVASTS